MRGEGKEIVTKKGYDPKEVCGVQHVDKNALGIEAAILEDEYNTRKGKHHAYQSQQKFSHVLN